jgi:DNA modification methylase
MELNKVILDDCLGGLKGLPDNSIDCCVTDPPYGLKFMGKKWDYDIPTVEIWEQVLRVLKPGSHILVACGTRTQHRMAVNIEDAGFEIRDVITWHYGSGFPKSLDVSKAIDKAAGVDREIISEGKTVKRIIPGADQDKTGSWIKDNGRTFTPSETLPTTEEAKKWDGWGTALKPATEFWTLARKPLSENTIAQNVIQHGTGGLNIDACRIEFESQEDRKSATFGTGISIIGGNYAGGNGTTDNSRKNIEADPAGRFPANVIFDDLMGAELDAQTGDLKAGGNITTIRSGKVNNIYGAMKGGQLVTSYGDTGGASRFFYCPKPDSGERGAGNNHPTVKPLALMHYLIKLICPIEPGRIVLEPFAGSGDWPKTWDYSYEMY